MKESIIRRILVLAVLGLLIASTAQATGADGEATALQAAKAEKFGEKLVMQVDRDKIDLSGHRLTVRLNRPAARIDVKVFGEDKVLLAEETTVVPSDAVLGEPILVSWSQSEDAPIARIELYGHDQEGNWVGVAIVPWSVKIPHEEVHFQTDKANIEASEVGKLEDSLKRIREAVERYRELGSIQLFIAGHTDTVGATSYNLELSRRRAQAIAAWFVKNRVGIPVAFEGFGESVPLVETKDEVDEPRNRRVDYILSIEPPAAKAGRLPAWKYLNRAK